MRGNSFRRTIGWGAVLMRYRRCVSRRVWFAVWCAISALYWAALDAEGQTFTKRPRLFQVGPNPSAVVVQDLDGDGLPEIITTDRGILADPREERPANDELSILLPDRDGNYAKLHPSLKTDFAPYALAIANVDALKWPDIIVVSFLAVRNRDVCVFLNLKQEGLFKPFSFRVPDEQLQYLRQKNGDGAEIFTKPGLTSVAVQDITGDNLRDLVATGWSSDTIVFMPGHAETIFGAPKLIRAPGAPRDLQLCDFDRDGQADLAVVMYDTGELTLWKGDGKGNFEEVSRFPTRGRLPIKVKTSDVNCDGIPDLVVAHGYTDDSIVIFYGDGGFRFSVSQEILLAERREVLEEEIRDLVVEDLTGDRRPDIAAACFGSGKVTVLINQSADTAPLQRFGKERYTFESARPRALCAGDIDQDGKQDLAVALWDVNSIGILMGKS